jgi:hypothetical protein
MLYAKPLAHMHKLSNKLALIVRGDTLWYAIPAHLAIVEGPTDHICLFAMDNQELCCSGGVVH